MKYYCIKQHDITDCGAACLATICRQNGYKIGISKIREVAGTDKQGTNAYGVIKAAEQLGFSAKGVKGDKEAFFSEFPLPCIAHVIVDGALLHYVVIHKITKKTVVIADPGEGIVKLTPEEFFGEVHDEGKPPKYQWSGILILLVKNETFEKKNETKGIFSRFFHLLMPQKKLIFQIFLASLIYTVLGILAAFYFQMLIDSVLPDGLKKTLMTLSIGVILLNLFRVILNAFRSHLLLYLSQKLDIALLLGYYRHVMELPMNFFGTRKVGEIISRFNDAGKVRDAISGATLTIMIDTLMAVAGAIILYIQNSKLFFITIIMIVLYAVIVLGFNKWYEKLNRKEMEDNAQLTSYMVESLNGIQTVKAYNAERKVNRETEIKFVKLLRSVFNLTWANNIQVSLKTFVELIGGVVILWAGGVSVINGDMTIGALITFNSLLAYFLDPVKNLVDLQPQMQTAVVAADRLGEILDLEAEKQENEQRKMAPESLAGDIKFEHVNFRYGTRQRVLEDIDFTIKKGEKIAFVGESGSGKTTLLNCISTIDRVTAGHIIINGEDITKLKGNNLNKFRREELGFIFQDFNLLDTLTAYENIALALTIQKVKANEIDRMVNEIAGKLGIKEILKKYPYQVSGGQKQRIASARAIITNPKLILADEPTGALDSKAARQLLENFELLNQKMNATILMVTHDAFTASYANRILFIKDGKIFNELVKGNDTRKQFFEKIIEVQTLLGGDLNDVI